jgi:hypothetical protein
MVLRFLIFALLAALWWAALWLALPIGWLQGTMPSFIAVHVIPPFLPVVAWWAGKRAWTWRKAKVKERAEKAEAAEKAAAQEAAKAAHQAEQERKRAHVECRAVWAALASVPDWAKAGAEQCAVLEQEREPLQGTGQEAALTPSLQQVFAAAFKQCEALVWLPVIFAADEPGQSGRTRQAWHQAIVQSNIERYPEHPDCAVLPGDGEIPDRLIALFENDPALPAVILIGMASPLADAVQEIPDSSPGHAVTALLISRPGLTAPDEAQIAAWERQQANDPLIPYWERKQARIDNHVLSQWGRIPLPMAPIFLKSLPPIATLHQVNTIHNPASRQKALTQQFQAAIRGALACAGLRDLPFEGEEPKTGQPDPLELGWLVHNAGTDGLVALLSGLDSFDCELDPIKEASDVAAEHGEVGKAGRMLMLSETLIRMAQLQKPVLMADFAENESISIGFACPAAQKPATEMPRQQLKAAA